MSEDELTYGETIKQPFPKFEDVEKFNVPQWLRLIITDVKPSHLSSKWDYKAFKLAYENGVDITWKLKQTDPHADIKAEYEKAIAEGKIVKVFVTDMQNNGPYERRDQMWHMTNKYELRCYNIDWDKVPRYTKALASSFEDFRDEKEFNFFGKTAVMFWFISNFDSDDLVYFKYCRLAKGVEIKDEWLKEVK